MKNHYIFVLGKDIELSRAELQGRCEEVFLDKKRSLLLAKDLLFENPREIPRQPEQLFLDQLGGTIRFAQVLDEYKNKSSLLSAIRDYIQEQKPEGKIHLGVSAFGVHKKMVQEWLASIKGGLKRDNGRNVRLINPFGEAMSSGKVFGEKLLKKGFEFLIWKNEDSYLLGITVANQNIRNYTLRDREKDFRDSKMGMLPPKLAQMLVRFAQPKQDETIIDPFCGSGTINIEAGILGHKTFGSDKSDYFVSQSRGNFDQMAEKFRYDEAWGEFKTSDVIDLDWTKQEGVIATEGYLGHNFTEKPTIERVRNEERKILEMWVKTFEKLEDSNVRRVALCIPHWFIGREKHSFSKKLFAKLEKSSYTPLALFDGQNSYVYARDGAYVGREICVFERK